jgi:hypothetical protein
LKLRTNTLEEVSAAPAFVRIAVIFGSLAMLLFTAGSGRSA